MNTREWLHTTDHVIDLDPTVLGRVVFAQFFSRDNLQRVVSFGCNGAWLRDTRIFADEQKDDMNVVKIESGYCANSKILSYKSHQIRTLLGPASAETGPDDGLNKAASNASLWKPTQLATALKGDLQWINHAPREHVCLTLAIVAPAARPNTTHSVSALPPSRLSPWIPPTI